MIVFYLAGSLYLLFVLVVLVIWSRLKEPKGENIGNQKFSVIVPIRNEENNINKLLLDLNQQTFPANQFEVIVVDDHSSDDGIKKIEQIRSTLNYSMRIIALEGDKKGKKEAISSGIKVSNHDTIITTDGDCRVGKKWLMKIDENYQEEIVLVFGAVHYSPQKNRFDQFQALELSALVATGAAMSIMGLPGMCNGANFSFKKKVFYEVGGYKGNDALPTGDDEFLLRKVRHNYPDGIQFMKSKEGTVATAPVKKWSELISQKIRWASKWRHHRDFITKFFGGFIFGSNVLFATIIIILAFHGTHYEFLALFLAIKIVLEYTLAIAVLRTNHKVNYVVSSALLSLLYPFYTVVVGLLSVKGGYVWKGRRY